MPDFMADDYAFIARRLGEISGGGYTGKWALQAHGLLAASGPVWVCVHEPGLWMRTDQGNDMHNEVTLFDTEEDAIAECARGKALPAGVSVVVARYVEP